MLEYQPKKSNKVCYILTIPLTVRAFFIPQLKHLAQYGMDVFVVCAPDEHLQAELGNNIRYIPIHIPRGISLLGMVNGIFALVRLFWKEHFDLIQYSTPNAGLCASIAGAIARCPIRNYHLMGLRYLGAKGPGRLFLKTLEKMTCAMSTSVECVSRSNMEMGIKEGLFPEEKVTVVWNGSSGGVDLNRFDVSKRHQWRSEVRKELGYDAADFVYGFVGRITRDKGINELLEAYFSLKSDAKLFLIGRMEDMQTLDVQLMEKAKKHPNIQFHDAVADIERYYAGIDVLILPSYREGFGNVVIEAGAMGTPGIVSDIPGPTDAIEKDETALVVPVKDAVALAEAMKQIRTMNSITMGQNAAKFAKEKFDSRVLCKKILERKQSLIEKKTSS